jgi:2,5-furandicarboxylate decarboxylase 1
MSVSFREFLKGLREQGELLEISRPVDLRNIAALVPQSEKGLLFTNPMGYSMPVVSGLLQSRNRLAFAIGVPYGKIQEKIQRAMEQPIEPKLVQDGPVKEVVLEKDQVDLYQLPVPIFSTLDGGPMITGAIVIAEDPEYGMNAGMYRLMLKGRNITGIDIVTPNNLRKFNERALANKRPLPISICIGTHPSEMVAATFKASLGTNELCYAGGLRGEPLGLAPGVTIPVPCIADAEIVLEGEIIPEGWTQPEGPFGEFNRLMGGIHFNPRVKIHAVLHRRDPVYYALHMPWENIWMSAPIYEAAAWRVLGEAGVKATAINVTPGGCCHWHIIAAIRKQPGDGKNAIAALLSIADIKHVVVTDDDIDVLDPVEVEWAIATRVQADRDVVILSNARSKPLDPSLPPIDGIPTTAKMGIDATIPENVPKERYQRIVYFNQGQVRLEDYVQEMRETHREPKKLGREEELEGAAEMILEALGREHRFFAELLDLFPDQAYGTIARAIGFLIEKDKINQDKEGRYQLKVLHSA